MSRSMSLVASVLLFAITAAVELTGVWLLWRALRGGAGHAAGAAGAILLVAYGALVTVQPDRHFGRVLAAYGGAFVAGAMIWGVILDGFRPAKHDLIGATLCLLGMAVIMWRPAT